MSCDKFKDDIKKLTELFRNWNIIHFKVIYDDLDEKEVWEAKEEYFEALIEFVIKVEKEIYEKSD